MDMKNTTERMCVVCGLKNNKSELFRIVKDEEGENAYDAYQKMNGRSIYVCKDKSCLEKLSQNKKLTIGFKVLSEMAKELKNSKNRSLVELLAVMNRSGNISFGMDMVKDAISEGRAKLIIMATDISEKNKEKVFGFLKNKKTKYIYLEDKVKLGTIFDKEEVNVLALKNRKEAEGLLKRVGGGQIES